MNLHGSLIGMAAFAIIGAFHPIVVKTEYYFGVKVWPAFLLAGLLAITASLLVANTVGSGVLGVLGFSCLWSIGELREQAERVRKGWFPSNPRRVAPAGAEGASPR